MLINKKYYFTSLYTSDITYYGNFFKVYRDYNNYFLYYIFKIHFQFIEIYKVLIYYI